MDGRSRAGGRVWRRPVAALLLTLLSGPAPLEARDRVFALVAKSVDDPNFVAAWRGCAREAERQGDRCELLGGHGSADARTQADVVRRALASGKYAAMAISVAGPDPLAEVIRGARIPILTFDSPLAPRGGSPRPAYIGTDNQGLGRELARLAKALRPRGGTLCLMSDARDPNLIARVEGVRRELSGDPNWPADRRLEGQGGWTESPRSPWFTSDSPERTLDQLRVTFFRLRPDVFIAVGHHPVSRVQVYRELVGPVAAGLRRRSPVVLVATGAYSPELEGLRRDGLVHGFVSIDFERIGRITCRRMTEALEGRPLPPETFVENSTHATR